MADTYFLNVPLFQSVPDSWAIHQLFPVLPLPPSLEAPTRARDPGGHPVRTRTGSVDRFITCGDEEETTIEPIQPLKKGAEQYNK